MSTTGVIGLSAVAVAFFHCASVAGPGSTNIAPARIEAIAGWLAPLPSGVGRPASDRTAWGKIGQAPAFASVIPDAQTLAKQPVPALPDDLYLDYSKTGNRERCQAVLSARANRFFTLTMAECLQNHGAFITPLTETIEAICQERTWVYPAHDGRLSNFYGGTIDMDLRSTAVAWELATVDYLLGDKLSPGTRKLISENVRRRVLEPFRDMVEERRAENHWLRARHNWNAVCLSGVIGAALAMEKSPQERAFYIAAAERYVTYFLKGFTPDGYCSEGVGYWNYGFGRFLLLVETIRQATGGRLDLLADPAALQPALFWRRAEILEGIYPSISDVRPGSQPGTELVRYICERFELPVPASARAEFARPAGTLAATMLFSFLPSPLPVAAHPRIEHESPLRTWFKDAGVLICRPPLGSTRFAAALKGGNNAENHNHNDVGSFSVVSGRSMVICDPGSEVYTARTFGSHRYESKVLSSYGHAVPLVDGQMQVSGAQARGVVLRTDFRSETDTIAFDLRSAYKVPELQRLERTFVFHRQPASLTVRDEVEFSEPKTFQTAIITWGTWKKLSNTELLITDDDGAVRVEIKSGGAPFKVDSETLNEHVHTPRKPVRLEITLESPAKTAMVTVKITPAN